MKNKKDYNEIAKIEKAIKEKYGEEAIQNPKAHWNKEKEEKFLKDLKDFYNYNKVEKKTFEKNGFTLLQKDDKISNRTCPVCNTYSVKSKDDLYMIRFDCCWDCYIQFVEGREERWKTGWRPKT